MGLKEMFNSMQEIMAKIIDIDRLPSYEEAKQLFHFLEDRSHRDSGQRRWFNFCEDHGVHNVYNIEFINALANEIRGLNDSFPIVEICAGDGKLSHQLRKRGIDIKPTDDYSRKLLKNGLVEKLSHQEALGKYEPRVVLASWIPYSTIGFDILDYPSVKQFINIGEDVGGATWMTDNINEIKEWDREYLENVQKYGICITDLQKDLQSIIFHSSVSLFSREDTYSSG